MAGDGPERRDEGESDESPWGQMGQFLGHGLTWALSTLFFLGIGWWADGKVGTTPLLTILGAFVGGAAGFYSLYHHLVTSQKQKEDGGK